VRGSCSVRLRVGAFVHISSPALNFGGDQLNFERSFLYRLCMQPFVFSSMEIGSTTDIIPSYMKGVDLYIQSFSWLDNFRGHSLGIARAPRGIF
jgi:hypothetical protein